MQLHGSIWPPESPTCARGSRGCTVWSGIDCLVILLAGPVLVLQRPAQSVEGPRLGWQRTLGLCQEVRERAFHLAAIRRCAGQGRPESRRALLIIGWHRSGQNQAQAVVPEGCPRRTSCRINCLYGDIDSVKSVAHCECSAHFLQHQPIWNSSHN